MATATDETMAPSQRRSSRMSRLLQPTALSSPMVRNSSADSPVAWFQTRMAKAATELDSSAAHSPPRQSNTAS